MASRSQVVWQIYSEILEKRFFDAHRLRSVCLEVAADRELRWEVGAKAILDRQVDKFWDHRGLDIAAEDQAWRDQHLQWQDARIRVNDKNVYLCWSRFICDIFVCFAMNIWPSEFQPTENERTDTILSVNPQHMWENKHDEEAKSDRWWWFRSVGRLCQTAISLSIAGQAA